MSRSARMLSSSCCSPRRVVDHSRGEWVPLDDVISPSGRVLTACDLVSTNGEAEGRGTRYKVARKSYYYLTIQFPQFCINEK